MAGRRRLIGGLALTAVAVLAALVVIPAASSGNPHRQVTAGAKPTTTTTTGGPTTTTTTPPPPYGQPSIEVSALTYTASKTSTTISGGSFLVKNVSGALPTDVIVIQQRITVEYKTSANGKYTMMAVSHVHVHPGRALHHSLPAAAGSHVHLHAGRPVPVDGQIRAGRSDRQRPGARHGLHPPHRPGPVAGGGRVTA